MRELEIKHPNQVWAGDITFIPMYRGFMYLFALIDLFSRYIINWSISNAMTAEWCVSTIEEALLLHGMPEIINTDQGSQFTSDLYVDLLNEKEIKISMPACRPAGMAKVERLIISLSNDFGEVSNTSIDI